VEQTEVDWIGKAGMGRIGPERKGNNFLRSNRVAVLNKVNWRFYMTALVMQKLATALLNEGFVVKKIEDEQISSFDRHNDGEEYTGRIIIIARPVDDEEAEAETARLRKEKEKEIAKGTTKNNSREDIPF
jgi:hypothetical protein